MTKLVWDKTGERRFETGVDQGVLYLPNSQGQYQNGYVWNGLTAVNEAPTGAESNPQYADNMKYLNLKSIEEFGCTIEAFTYPEEFEQCDGTAAPEPGVYIHQQARAMFGFSYRTLLGNDTESTDLGYKRHLVWGCDAAPSEKSRSTVNDSPEATSFSWEVMTTAVSVGEINGVEYKPTAKMTLDSTKVDAARLKQLEDIIHGTSGSDPRLPLPAEVVAIFSGGSGLTEVTPNEPTFVDPDVTVPNQTGVYYTVDGQTVEGTFTITEPTLVKAYPEAGYRFPAVVDDEWVFEPA